MIKKPKSLLSFLIPILRRASMRWPNKIQARKNAKVVIEDGNFNNGNTKFKVKYKCQNPKCGKLVNIDCGNIDHKIPVVKVEGFTTWDNYINSLFCELDNLWHLCLDCHSNKTKIENDQRASNRIFKKPNKYKALTKYSKKAKKKP